MVGRALQQAAGAVVIQREDVGGAGGEGNQMLGAPNLTDKIWLVSGTVAGITSTINNGRHGVMPAWKDFLGEEKSHIVSAYVYSLSQAK